VRKGIVLGGYFGFGNAGDELIARVVRGAAPSLPWRTLGQDTSRWNPFGLVNLLRRSKALVYGGGELFQARTSRRSLLYYAALPILARALGARFFAFGMGLDPGLSHEGTSLAVRVLDRAERIWFRDEASLSLYKNAGGRAEARVAADPVWAWPSTEEPAPPAALRRVLWIPRAPAKRERIEALAARVGGTPGYLFLHPSRDAGAFDSPPGTEPWDSVEDLLPIFGGYDAVVSMRYHGLLLAALAGRPAVALAAHPKVSALAEELGFPSLPFETSAARVSEALMSAFAHRMDIPLRVRERKDRAQRGLDELRETLEAI
jgi:polysaccharide pyruvyl transferase CsaB